MDPVWSLFLVPLGLGLLGFLEPCSIGASLLFLKSVEGNSPQLKLLQVGVFTLTRAVFIGSLGAVAALVGTAFLGFQRAGYVMLGIIYVVLGLIYLTGNAGKLMRTFGPKFAPLSNVRGSASLAVLFGLNVPACAGPLLAAVLGSAAVAGAAKVGQGFFMLALFGIGLSLPLLLALAFGPAQRMMEKAGRYTARVPIFIGMLFVALGGWSIWFGATVRLSGG